MADWVPLVAVAAGLVLCIVLAILFLGRKREPSVSELGPVSHQWMAQYRARSRDLSR